MKHRGETRTGSFRLSGAALKELERQSKEFGISLGDLSRAVVDRYIRNDDFRTILTILQAIGDQQERLGEIHIWLAVLTIGIATAAHQAWSANIFTTVSDMFPKRAVASVTGIGGMAGGIDGFLLSNIAGQMLSRSAAQGRIEEGYAIMFMICGTAYLVAWVAMHLLAPKFRLVTLD